MRTASRTTRVFWLLGLLILVGSAAGASWVLYAHSGELVPQNRPRSGDSAPAIENEVVAVAVGYADIRGVLRSLHPVQQGRVEKVDAQEGQKVKAGELLLSLDKSHTEALVRQAQADLVIAQTQLEQARKLIEQQALREAQQSDAIKVAQSQLSKAESELKRQEGLRGQINENLIEIAQANVTAARLGLSVEEKKLRELQLNDPRLTIRSAEAAVAAKQAQLDQARKALEECDLRAPEAGTVLRLTVGRGDVLGSQPKQPAVLFLPNEPFIIRAELDQETASRVQEGQKVLIEDDTKAGATWTGKVQQVGNSYLQRRPSILDPFQINTTGENRLLECIVVLDPEQRPLRYHQRVRVKMMDSK